MRAVALVEHLVVTGRPRALDERPATIAIGDEGDARMMRDAMNAGVRDFLTHPCSADELLASDLTSAAAADFQRAAEAMGYKD